MEVFDEADSFDVLKLVKQTMHVEHRELKRVIGKDSEGRDVHETWEGVCVTFQTNTGRGTGAVVMPVEEFEPFVQKLEAAAASNFEKVQEPYKYETAAEVLGKTISLTYSDNQIDEKGNPLEGEIPSEVTLSTRRGKGSKPSVISREKIGDVINFLRNALEPVNNAAAKVRDAVQKRDASDTETP